MEARGQTLSISVWLSIVFHRGSSLPAKPSFQDSSRDSLVFLSHLPRSAHSHLHGLDAWTTVFRCHLHSGDLGLGCQAQMVNDLPTEPSFQLKSFDFPSSLILSICVFTCSHMCAHMCVWRSIYTHAGVNEGQKPR